MSRVFFGPGPEYFDVDRVTGKCGSYQHAREVRKSSMWVLGPERQVTVNLVTQDLRQFVLIGPGKAEAVLRVLPTAARSSTPLQIRGRAWSPRPATHLRQVLPTNTQPCPMHRRVPSTECHVLEMPPPLRLSNGSSPTVLCDSPWELRAPFGCSSAPTRHPCR